MIAPNAGLAPDWTSAISPARSSELRSGSAVSSLVRILRPLASLKLTVTLFVLSFVLILVGTLAQWEKNMWQVLSDYFRTYVAWVDFRVFLPPSFFPNAPKIPGGFYFPGGKSLGILLLLNLVAAHALRFKVQAKKEQLWYGLILMTVGLGITAVVILGVQQSRGIQAQPWISFDAYWQLLRLSSVLLFAVTLFWALRYPFDQSWTTWLRISGAVTAGAFCMLMLIWGGNQRLSDASMRILWQLGQSGLAAVLVLWASVLLFKQRGGIVTIHLGIGLLMIGELIVGMFAVEEQILLGEGQTTNFARQAHQVELAIIDKSPADYDQVIAIPQQMLQPGRVLSHPELPFSLEVLSYYRNSELQPLDQRTNNPNITGAGATMKAVPVRSSGGADPRARPDIASCYVRILQGGMRQERLLTQWRNDAEALFAGASDDPEILELNGKTWELALRARRNYKPYRITLVDVRKDDYLGTNTPRDYSSYINLEDDRHDSSLQNYRIWMNNPLRYAGETFYQSGYHHSPQGEYTTLAVVTNQSWMIPYAACAFVALGMLWHFGGTLARFLNREARHQAISGEPESPLHKPAPLGARRLEQRLADWALPLTVLALYAGSVLLTIRPSRSNTKEFDFTAFGQIPIVFEGRVQPIDTLARNTLKILSNKETLRMLRGDETKYQAAQGERQAAVRWLLDVATNREDATRQRTVRIENLAVQNLMGVERRKGLLYSIEELAPRFQELDRLAREAHEVEQTDPTRLTLEQRKISELDRRLRAYLRLRTAFQVTDFPQFPTREEREKDPAQFQARLQEIAERAVEATRRADSAKSAGLPLLVPGKDRDDWLPFGSALDRAYIGRLMGGQGPDVSTLAWTQILQAYDQQDPREFNRAVAAYQLQLRRENPAEVDLRKVQFEAWFNRVQLFQFALVGYLVAFGLVALSWVYQRASLQQAAFWLLLANLVMHSFALGARIYISGRPPVTNLYSSAVFIGWSMVIVSLLFEWIYRQGWGQIVAAVSGFSTLIIARNLAGEGDTFTVLQAVLDTQFWLATHVVCITLGYSTTFLAGLFSIIYVLQQFWHTARENAQQSLTKIIYGTLCFAIFFSFVGTVLGGLWADDSWGRFWGWDPKENGALMIVLWNAIILHARWDGMIRGRGMAVLSILGNVVTAWSWFGVNELGIGLHSYGFTEGVLPALGIFALSQLILAAIGIVAPSGNTPPREKRPLPVGS